MAVKHISPEEARELMKQQGYVYLDVRSIPEFQAGHPEGAFNIPLMHLEPRGIVPNHDFVNVVERNFAKEAKLVLGCKSGGRSLQAAMLLATRGYADIVVQRCGYDGAYDATGRLEPGWRSLGLPVATEAGAERSYEALKAKA